MSNSFAEETLSPYIGRFAPSPTGPLHFGSLVAALASYVDARAHKGRWLIRIENIDTQRCSSEHEMTILRQLRDYGFEHDGSIVRQSDRTKHYESALSLLSEKSLTYRCRCTRKLLASAPRNRDGEVVYPGTCRELHLHPNDGPATAIRINLERIAQSSCISFVDRALGSMKQNVCSEVGDFVLLRADGDYAYQLAVVVDDALQGVTHVVRGADLLSNTARQIVLQQALGKARPTYLHIPLATNDRGEKLSKQTLAPALPETLSERMQTLRDAWLFLQQANLEEHDSPQTFLREAIAVWQPERLQTTAEAADA